MTANQAYQCILFDIGGVLVEFKGSSGLVDLAKEVLTRNQIREYRRKTAPWVKKLESGACTVEEFAEGFLTEWPLKVTPQELLTEIQGWPLRMFPGAAEMLERLSKDHRLACLSNTNPLHWPKERDEMGMGRIFDRSYISYEIGHLKPDAGAYLHAIADLGCEPGRILFLDDNLANVEAARELGIDAHRTAGFDEARSTLRSLGLLP